jgi:outer membrane receptor protein involved in Fe transport
MNFIRKTFLLISVSVLAGNIYAQPPQMNFFIKGKAVNEQTRQPLEYVSIAVYSDKDSSLISGTISQPDGRFSITVNRPGKFYLVADFVGFRKKIISDILLKPGSETFDAGDISLEQETVMIGEVEVVGDKPFVSYQIDKKVVDVALNPSAQGGTAVDALQNVPSIKAEIDGTVTLRGSSNFTVLIDGRQSPLSGSDALNQIPASAIDKIEIITNPSAKYDPDGTSGIINIISKKGKLNGHSAVINASAGNAPMYGGDFTYSYRFEKMSVTTGINYRNFRNTMYTIDDETNTYTNISGGDSITKIYNDMSGKMQMHNFSAKAAVDYQLTGSNTLTVGGEYSDFGFNRGFDSEVKNTDALGLNSYNTTTNKMGISPSSVQLNLGNKQVFADNQEHYLTVDLTAQFMNPEDDNIVQRDSTDADWNSLLLQKKEKDKTSGEAQRIRVEVNYSNPISEKFKFETGYTLRFDNANEDYRRFYPVGEDDWEVNSEYNDNSDFSRTINAVWAVGKGNISGIQYSAGIRGEVTNQIIKTEKDNLEYKYNYPDWYPSFSLSKEFKGSHQLQASFSKRINRPQDWQLSPFPSLSDGFTVFESNPDLEPEYASAFEVNYQKSWGVSFMSLETFYNKTDNKIERILEDRGGVNVRKAVNMGYDLSIGGEASGNIKMFPWLIANPSASVYYYEVEGPYGGDTIIATNTNWEAKIAFNINLPTKTRLQINAEYEGPQVEIDGREEAVKWVSASVRQDFLDRKLSATLRVDDIFSSRMHKQTTVTQESYIYSERWRKSPMFFLTLNYRFNQNNNDRKKSSRDDMNGNGNGNGMDMDF